MINTEYTISSIKKITTKSAESDNSFASVTLTRGQRERMAGRFVIKKFKDNLSARSSVDSYMELKKNGFPVPNTYRLLGEEGTEVVVSDLTINGEKVVYSINELGPMKNDTKKFLTNYDELSIQIMDLAIKADKLGYWLSLDTFFIQVDKDGKGTIVLGDLGDKGFSLSVDEIKSGAINRIVKKQGNPSQEQAAYFLDNLRKIRNN